MPSHCDLKFQSLFSNIGLLPPIIMKHAQQVLLRVWPCSGIMLVLIAGYRICIPYSSYGCTMAEMVFSDLPAHLMLSLEVLSYSTRQ